MQNDSPEPTTKVPSDPNQPRRECVRKAMDLLARRPHFRRQLEAKLGHRGYSREEIEAACTRLESSGYLDDLECARGLALGSMRRKGYGPRRVRVELSRRGAPEEVVDAVLEEAFVEGQMPRLREAVERWLRRNEWNRGRLSRHLQQRGFDAGPTIRMLDEVEETVRRAADVDSH